MSTAMGVAMLEHLSALRADRCPHPVICLISQTTMVLALPDDPGTLFGILRLAERTRARSEEELKVQCTHVHLSFSLLPSLAGSPMAQAGLELTA